MPKKITVKITEESDFLQEKLSQSKGNLERDRIKTLIYIKEGKFHFQNDICKELGRSEKTIRTWIQEYSKNGFKSLLKERRGGNNSRTISERAIKLISQKNRRPYNNLGFSSFMELKLLLEKELDEIIDYNALYSYYRRNHKKKFERLKIIFKKREISSRLDKQIRKLFPE
jgi:transposase